MPWRPYVITNIYGQKKVMRDTVLYDTKKEAITAMRRKNQRWMEMNYSQKYSKMSNFEYGAVEVGKSGYKYKKGDAGNKQLLNDLNKINKKTQNIFKF